MAFVPFTVKVCTLRDYTRNEKFHMNKKLEMNVISRKPGISISLTFAEPSHVLC